MPLPAGAVVVRDSEFAAGVADSGYCAQPFQIGDLGLGVPFAAPPPMRGNRERAHR